jgi:CRP-like cAMP-binding protein
MTDEEMRELLRGTPLFASFNDEQLDVVPKVALTRTFDPGTTIVEHGEDRARSFWLIIEGRVEVSAGDERLTTLGPGDHFGEIALLTGAPRSADVIAMEPTTALELAESHLRGLIHSDPDVGLALAQSLSARLRWVTERLADLLRSSPEAAAEAGRLGISTDAAERMTHVDFPFPLG